MGGNPGKTTDALRRIESSTGMTEKRIENIISGRVNALSEEIADIAVSSKSKEDIKEEIRSSIIKDLNRENYESKREEEREKKNRTKENI